MKTQKWTEPKPKRKVGLEDMLKQIPRATFIRMVMKSGLIPADQRAMVEAHGNL